jgi:sugar phosphate isomerase/epimerase
MFFGYNTNGFAHHRLHDALTILAGLGYQGVALTLDYHVLNPFAAETENEIPRIRQLLEELQLRLVIETGARFLLDPRRKHQPTLISPTPAERKLRLDFLTAAVQIAAGLGSDAVSFWSGTAVDDVGPGVWMQRLIDGCRRLCDVAAALKVRLAFEPEPGMFIDNMARFAELNAAVSHPAFGLTIDIGHLHCQGEVPIADYLRRWQHILWNVHIEDMRRGKHEHLMFGDGEIDFAPIMSTLREIGYAGGVYVELTRHSHDAVATAEKSLAFLRSLNETA